MGIVYILLLIHLLICLILLTLRIWKIIRCRYITIFVAFLLPVWGFLFLIIQRVSDRHEERLAHRIELERLHASEINRSIRVDSDEANVVPLSEAMIVNEGTVRRNLIKDILYDLNSSIEVDKDDINDKVVPLSEALAINDVPIRRELIMDILYTNPNDYIHQLTEAKENDDTEVVHYAVTALVEMQKEYDQKFQDLMEKRSQNPKDPELDVEYQRLLESYLESGLLKGDGLKSTRLKYRSLLQKLLGRDVEQGKWSLLQKKADVDLKLKDSKALADDIAQMMQKWPKREENYYWRIKCAALDGKRDEINDILSEIHNNENYLSPSLRELVGFWQV